MGTRLAEEKKRTEFLREELRKRDELPMRSLVDLETILGVKRSIPVNEDQILIDARAIINYSNSQDYKIWSSELWAKILEILDELQKPDLNKETVDFYRGSLKNSFDILRVSYKARFFVESKNANERKRVIV